MTPYYFTILKCDSSIYHSNTDISKYLHITQLYIFIILEQILII